MILSWMNIYIVQNYQITAKDLVVDILLFQIR
jgi:hypothetical protein